MMDARTTGLVGGVVVLLGLTTAIVHFLKRRADTGLDTALLETFGLRIRAWWLLFALLAAAFYLGEAATIALFGLMSFWCLREFVTLIPTRGGDHRTLFVVFFLVTPLQFLLVSLHYHGLFSVAIPIYAVLLVPTAIAMSDDAHNFLERTAKIQVGMLICVYCLSHAPALLTLNLHGHPPAEPEVGAHARLLFFLLVTVQLSDVLQYAWAQLPTKHVIAPSVNPTRTWEGLLGGAASSALVGALLWWATPFSPWMAGAMSLVIAVMSFAGGITMSAIKRDRGVKDYGTLVEGHGGLLDRLDSICFAAPVFYHLTRLWLSANGFPQA